MLRSIRGLAVGATILGLLSASAIGQTIGPQPPGTGLGMKTDGSNATLPAARTNLGLGTTDTPTFAGTVLSPAPAATIATSQAQAVGGSTLLPFASTTGAAVGMVVQATGSEASKMPLATSVASIVSDPPVTLTANGISAIGQKVLTTTATAGSSVGQQCVDLTTPTAIEAGNVIASIQAGVSITMTRDLAAATANVDSIRCDPVVTLTTATTAAVAATSSINFITNSATLSSSSTFYNRGSASIEGQLAIGGAFAMEGGTTPASYIPSVGLYKDGSYLGLTGAGIEFNAPAFPLATNTYDFGGSLNAWRLGYFRGITFGEDALLGYIISGRTENLGLAAVNGPSNPCGEIDIGTPGSAAYGTNALAHRFNWRSLCAPQGQSIINSFESITFPFATTFPSGDLTTPGIGMTNGATTAVVTGSITGSVFTVTGVTSGTIAVGNFLTDALAGGITDPPIGGGVFVASLGTGVGGTGTYNLNLAFSTPIASGTVTLVSHQSVTLNKNVLIQNGKLGIGTGTTKPWSPLTLYGASSAPSLTHHATGLASIAVSGAVELAITNTSVSPFGIGLQARSENADGLAFPLDLNPLGGGITIGGNLFVSSTAPTIASGGCTTGSAQSVSASNGSAAFELTLGGATCGSTITLTMPAAAHNWVCDAHDITTPAGNVLDMTGAASTTAVVLTNFSRTLGTAANFTGADKLAVKCTPY